MKQISFLVIIIFLTSFKITQPNNFDFKNFQRDFVKVKNELYVSKYETSNLEYRIFLSDIYKSGEIQLYTMCLPDTLSWVEDESYNKPFVEYYFRKPSYDNYPVVGITHEAANEYCNWLTNKYNQESKRKFKKVLFTLLSKDEWIFAANNGDINKIYAWGDDLIQNKKSKFLCNYRHSEESVSLVKESHENNDSKKMEFSRRSTITAPVKSFSANSIGIYNMCGNVAEMIEEKGIAKGGSYKDGANEVKISSEKKYTKPTSDIGFRVAMKILEK